VLKLIANGKDNAMIAGELHISPKTVKNHISNILMKLQIDNRIQAASTRCGAGSSRSGRGRTSSARVRSGDQQRRSLFRSPSAARGAGRAARARGVFVGDLVAEAAATPAILRSIRQRSASSARARA
jgi:predicted ArsR family transcriptional regulator